MRKDTGITMVYFDQKVETSKIFKEILKESEEEYKKAGKYFDKEKHTFLLLEATYSAMIEGARV